MEQEIRSKIDGEFHGFNGEAVFKLSNGQVWQQSRHKYLYCYKYRPNVCIKWDGNGYFIEVEGLAETVPIRRVNVEVEGSIVSDFKGFDGKSIFEFQNGQVWQQAEYKYKYHYAYRPSAIIISGLSGHALYVEGMDEHIKVRRIR